MLKRQRAPSPPLPSSSVPLIGDTPSDSIERKTKRRRTLPPALDGASRGWARSLEIPFEEEDDEDYLSDDEVENLAPSDRNQQQQQQSEYTSTNTMLRELHTQQQQQRTCISSASTPQTAYSTNLTIPSRHLTPDKGVLLLQQERLRPKVSSVLMEKGYHGDGLATEESNRITERYEGTNKVLGSLFLSRRRELDSPDKIPNA